MSNELEPTIRPDNAQDEADEDLRAYLRRLEMGLEQLPEAPGASLKYPATEERIQLPKDLPQDDRPGRYRVKKPPAGRPKE